MKAKLIKEKDGRFHLWLNVGTKDADHIASNEPLVGEWGRNLLKYKLSLKNCQAIERGYDLDELTENFYERTGYHDFDSHSYKLGFQKALEILGDKRFTDKDLDKAIEYGHESRMPFNEDWYNEFIQSLQQNEWEVEIIMECTQCQSYGYVSECRDNCNKKFLQPKLDADGCLILKRVI